MTISKLAPLYRIMRALQLFHEAIVTFLPTPLLSLLDPPYAEIRDWPSVIEI